LTKHSMWPKAVNIASTKPGRSPRSARSFPMRTGARQGPHWLSCVRRSQDRSFGHRRPRRSLRQGGAQADPTHSARDGRDLRRRSWVRHNNSTLWDAISRCQQY
jgi:hypothetical protein